MRQAATPQSRFIAYLLSGSTICLHFDATGLIPCPPPTDKPLELESLLGPQGLGKYELCSLGGANLPGVNISSPEANSQFSALVEIWANRIPDPIPAIVVPE